MRNYEAVCVFRTDEDNFPKGQEAIKAHLADLDATFVKEEDMGQRALAYPIKKHVQGHYYVYYVQMDPQQAHRVEEKVRHQEQLLRFLMVRRDEDEKAAPDKPAAAREQPEPAVEEPAAEEPAVEEPAVEEPAAAPETAEAAPEQPEPAAEEPETAPEKAEAAPEEPAVEEPAAAPETAEAAPEQPEPAAEEPEPAPEKAEAPPEEPTAAPDTSESAEPTKTTEGG